MFWFKKNKIIFFLFFILIFSLLIFLYLFEKKEIKYYLINQNKIEENNINFQKIINQTIAEGVVVYDLSQDKVLFSKNIDKKYSFASFTKIITAVAVYEKNKNLLNEIRIMLKTSSNSDAEKLALVLGENEKQQVEYINNFTKKNNLYFRNVSGLDIKVGNNNQRLAGGEGMPLDLINFIKEYYKKYPEIFDQTIIQKNNTNIIVNKLNFLTFSKTGFTDLSGGNLVIIVKKGLNRDILIMVLNSTEKNRFVDVQNIANLLLQSSI